MKRALALAVAPIAICACRDLSSFSTIAGDRYEGSIAQGEFVRAGIASDAGPSGTTTLCLTLDTDHLQDTPGKLSSSDGRFAAVSLRPIPQVWHDPLSTLDFGEGRIKNLLYVATASTPFGDGNGNDVFVVVSLMQAGGVEVRLLRGAPGLAPDGSAATGPTGNLFAVFDLSRQRGPCSY